MSWQVSLSGHIEGTPAEQQEAEQQVLANLRAVVEQLKAGGGVNSATATMQHHDYVDLIGPRSPEEIRRS